MALSFPFVIAAIRRRASCNSDDAVNRWPSGLAAHRGPSTRGMMQASHARSTELFRASEASRINSARACQCKLPCADAAPLDHPDPRKTSTVDVRSPDEAVMTVLDAEIRAADRRDRQQAPVELSHNELEDATKDDCTAGANVLLHATLALAGLAD